MARPRVFRPSPAALCLTGLLLAIGVICPAAESAVQDSPPSRWWFEAQLGAAALVLKPAAAMAQSGWVHPRVTLEGGVHISRNLRLGLLLGAGAMGDQFCQGGDDLDCYPSDQTIFHQYLTLVANPGGGHWVYEVAAGWTYYDLSPNSIPNRLSHDPSGPGVRLSVGRDWDFGAARRHLGWRASLDAADPGRASGSGSSGTYHATVSLAVSLSWY